MFVYWGSLLFFLKYFWKLLSWFLHCHLREGSLLVAGAPAGCAISVVSHAGGGSSSLTLSLQASPSSSAAAVSASLPPRGWASQIARRFCHHPSARPSQSCPLCPFPAAPRGAALRPWPTHPPHGSNTISTCNQYYSWDILYFFPKTQCILYIHSISHFRTVTF